MEALEIAGVRWTLGPGADPARARRLLEEALRRLAEGAPNRKPGRRKALYELALEGDAPDHLLKVNRYERGAGRVRRLRPSKARRELALAAALAERGVDVPLPVAAGERRRGPWLDACYLLVPRLAGFQDLRALWGAGEGSLGERRTWVVALGRCARRLHEAGLDQRDFGPNNFLVRRAAPPELRPVDFERARLRAFLGPRPRRRMLAKLQRHAWGASAATRLRFLRAYADGDAAAARRWWRELEPAIARLAVRDLARMRRTATADGRRFERIERAGWTGWARRDSPRRGALEAELSRDLEGPAGPPVEALPGLWHAQPAGASAARTWALAQILWMRGGAGPRPVGLVQRRGRLHMWLEREPGSRPLVELADEAGARRAAAVLLDRLRALGRLDPALDARQVALHRTPRGAWGAQLLDPTALRPGPPDRAARGAVRVRAWLSGSPPA